VSSDDDDGGGGDDGGDDDDVVFVKRPLEFVYEKYMTQSSCK